MKNGRLIKITIPNLAFVATEYTTIGPIMASSMMIPDLTPPSRRRNANEIDINTNKAIPIGFFSFLTLAKKILRKEFI